jgi:molecular chaperone HscA
MALLQISEPVADSKDNSDDKTNQEIVVGIDLGTTNSLIAARIEKEIIFFADENNNQIHPSIIAFDSSSFNLLCGYEALNSISKIKISSIKRLMGKSLSDIKDIDSFAFEIDKSVESQENKGSIRIIIDGNKYTPEELSAVILKYLKNLAEKKLQQKITRAVITVPAYFDEAARNATKLAANLAGLEVLRLVNEPTAAALAYNLDQQSKQEELQEKSRIYCIYDLGGGTFDVSILKMQKGIFKVLGVSGDTNLGGDDFDLLILKKIQEKIKQDLKISDFNFNQIFTLKTHAREIKERLSYEEQIAQKINFDSQEINFEITRTDFLKLINDKISLTIKVTKNLIDDLELQATDITGVVMVGGSTRIPLIKEKLAGIFKNNQIFNDLDPDRIVAYGAALQAYNLATKNNGNLLLDVTPLSLGLETMGGIVEKIIPRNSTIPTSVTKEYTTYIEGQTGIKLHILQGERELAKDNRSLGEFTIKNLPALKAGAPKIAVTFKIDADGLLTVSASEKITGQIQEIIIKPSYGLEPKKIKKMLLEYLKHANSDMEARLLSESVVEAKQDIIILKKDLTNYSDLISKEELEIITNQITKLKTLLENPQDRHFIASEHKKLEKLAENFILKKVNQNLSNKLSGKKIEDIL